MTRASEARKIFSGACVLIGAMMLIGCQTIDPLEEYRPVTDPKFTDSSKFQSDVTECREIAIELHEEYKKRQTNELITNVLIGAVTGAATGAIIGSGTSNQNAWIAGGTAAGAAAGASNLDYHHDLVKYGPRRVVDRCMANRGHLILNDPGKGT